MPRTTSNVIGQAKHLVRRDLRSVRKLLRRIKRSVRLAEYVLLGRRNPARMLDYLDRRDRERSSEEMPIYLTPAAFDGQYVEQLDHCGRVMIAMTKDASLRGIGFSHDEPVEGDYAIVTFDLMDGDPPSLLLEVRWSNLEQGNLFMSGGRFLGITELPELSRHSWN